MIDKNQPWNQLGDDVIDLANTITKSVLEDYQLYYSEHKKMILHFLHDEHLIPARGPGIHLGSVNLSGANLSGVNLSDSQLGYADLNGADLSGANLQGIALPFANLNGADLSGADLSGAYFLATRLRRANLTGANLAGANMPYVDLSGADLSGADLSGVANLAQEQINVAKGDENTELPGLQRPDSWKNT